MSQTHTLTARRLGFAIALLTSLASVGLPLAARAAAGSGLSGTVPAPSVEAKAYILVDYQTGAVLAEKSADDHLEPASLTKIMTLYTTAGALKQGLIKLTDEVEISRKAWKMEGSRMFAEIGKRIPVDQLINGIAIQSGNDASVALAEHVSGSEEVFAALMTKHAKDLGMNDSSFSDATGLPDPNNYTSARDLAKLAAAFIRNYPEIYQRFSLKEYTFNGIRQHNRNRMLARDPTVDGIKTGHTESAGYCLVTSALRDGTRLISVVMGTASDSARTEASYALLNYGYRFFETRQLYAAKDAIASPRVWGGATETVALGSTTPVIVTLPRNRFKEVKATAKLDEPIRAPIEAGKTLGRMVLTLDDREIASIPLAALTDVPEGSFFSRIVDDVKLMMK